MEDKPFFFLLLILLLPVKSEEKGKEKDEEAEIKSEKDVTYTDKERTTVSRLSTDAVFLRSSTLASAQAETSTPTKRKHRHRDVSRALLVVSGSGRGATPSFIIFSLSFFGRTPRRALHDDVARQCISIGAARCRVNPRSSGLSTRGVRGRGREPRFLLSSTAEPRDE